MSYETCTLSAVMNGLLRVCGIAPSDATQDTKLALLEYLATRLEAAWQWYRWPVLLTIEQREYRATWTAQAYVAGSIIWHAATEAYYEANALTAGADVPGTSTKWDELGDFHRYVAYDQTGETAFRVCLRAWETDPREDSTAVRLAFEVAPEGIRFAPDAVDQPWLEIEERAPDFHAEAYDSAATYAAGERLYYTDGEVYEVVTATTAGQTPDTHAAKFEVLTIPRFLRAALVVGAQYDWQTKNGKPDPLLEPEFAKKLDEEVWQLTTLQGQRGQREPLLG